jgi:hypothetical protein
MTTRILSLPTRLSGNPYNYNKTFPKKGPNVVFVFRILCFSEEETFNVYKATAAVMNMGELVSNI